MKKIIVCVGSSCHLKGSHQIVEKIKKLVSENDLEVEVELEGSFCQGKCMDGVVVKFGEHLVTNLSPDNIEDVFYREMEGDF